jgi:hypothetical protein
VVRRAIFEPVEERARALQLAARAALDAGQYELAKQILDLLTGPPPAVSKSRTG